MTTPYAWRPHGASTQRQPPAVGSIVALDHEAYEIVEVNERPRSDWTDRQWERVHRDGSVMTPLVVVARRVSGPDAGREELHHFKAFGDIHLGTYGGTSWTVYHTEHWPACGRCGEPSPCRETSQDRYVTERMTYMERFASSNVCSSCQKPFTSRQKSITFPDNLEIPGGPPVVFHAAKASCRQDAWAYQQRWLADDPDRKPFFPQEEPFSGIPNPTQRRLLAKAARGELACHSTLIHAGDEWGARWYPSGLTTAESRYLHQLIAAELISSPLVFNAEGGTQAFYHLTATGVRLHRQHPPQERRP